MNAVQFASPLALWALLALPIIWWLLRATPPRPVQQAFPPLRILQLLNRTEETPDKTPWWLLLLRLCLAAVLIGAVAHPFTRETTVLTKSTAPLLVIMDDGWAAAPQWSQRQEAIAGLLGEAEDRVVYLASTAQPEKPQGKSATDICYANDFSWRSLAHFSCCA